MKSKNDYSEYGRDERNHSKIDRHGIKDCFCERCKAWSKYYPSIGNSTKPAPKVNQLGVEAILVTMEAIALLKTKNKDYGSNSISRAPGGAMNGLLVRLHDKIERADHLIRSKDKPNNESIRDTFIDILNYAIISLLVLDEKWDKLK